MFKKFLIVLAITLPVIAFASNVKRYFQDAKFPNQELLHHQLISDPAAADTQGVASALQGPTSGTATSTTSGITNPDVPRNLVITPGTSTGDVGTCTVTVSGTNIYGQSITEDFAFADNASSATTGAKAFKTVTSVAWAANCEDTSFAATWSIGNGEKLGLERCLDFAGHLVFSTVAGAYESTRPTVAANATAVESNTADFNGTMNGSNDFEAFFVENFRCSP